MPKLNFTQDEPQNRPGTGHTAEISPDGKVESTTWQQADRQQFRLIGLDLPTRIADFPIDCLMWISGSALVLQLCRLLALTVVPYGSATYFGGVVIATALLYLGFSTIGYRHGSQAVVYRVVLTLVSAVFVLF